MYLLYHKKRKSPKGDFLFFHAASLLCCASKASHSRNVSHKMRCTSFRRHLLGTHSDSFSSLYHNFQQVSIAENVPQRILIFMIASPERGDSPRGGEMPVGQRGPLSTRGTAVRRWRGSFVKSLMTFDVNGDPSVSATHCQLPFQGSLPCQAS